PAAASGSSCARRASGRARTGGTPGRRSGAAPGATAAPPTWSSTSPRAAAGTRAGRRSRARARSRSRGRSRRAGPRRAAGARSASRFPAAALAPSSRRALFRRRGEQALARHLLDRRGGGDRVLAEIALVIALDLAQPVHVVPHQAGGARHAGLGDVAHPVQALERGAVAEVEA